jgi:hypothetical protein
MKKPPFAFVLYMEHPKLGTLVGVCATLEQVEEVLRRGAASTWAGLVDDEIVETAAEHGWCVRVFACTEWRSGQSSTELMPFARKPA